VKNRVGLPVPRGFAVTTAAFRAFLEAAGLPEEIARLKLTLALDDPGSLAAVSEDIQHLILRAEPPPDLARAIAEAHRDMAAEAGTTPGELRVAMRSSAIGEDGELSFAGQYLSILNVPPNAPFRLHVRGRKMYTHRHLLPHPQGHRRRRRGHGVPAWNMVPSRAAGVMFTATPLHRTGRVI
jgi:pyruvate,water dikinase